MCDCIKKLESEVRERLNKPWKDAVLDDCRCEHLMLGTKSGKWMLGIPFKAQWHRVTKAGGSQQRKTVTCVMVDYCPFCGEKIEAGKSAPIPTAAKESVGLEEGEGDFPL